LVTFKYLKEDMPVHTEADKLSNKALILSGFSFTALTFVIGFYNQNLVNASDLTAGLLFSTITFLLTAEIADSSIKIWELVVAETMYFVSALVLLLGFMFFIWQKMGTASYLVESVLAIAFVFYIGLILMMIRAVSVIVERQSRRRK